jgi:hypothetical protein
MKKRAELCMVTQERVQLTHLPYLYMTSQISC